MRLPSHQLDALEQRFDGPIPRQFFSPLAGPVKGLTGRLQATGQAIRRRRLGCSGAQASADPALRQMVQSLEAYRHAACAVR